MRVFKDRGKWRVDLRPEFSGWKYPLGPDTLDDGDAYKLAYAKRDEMREEARRAVSRPGAALELKPKSAAPATMTELLDALQRTKEWKSAGGRDWWEKNADLVRHEMGHHFIADFCRPGGQELLSGYMRTLKSGHGARTVRGRFCILGQAFEYATDPEERRWLPYVPRFPDMPKKPKPLFNWIGEREFRAGRARLYADVPRGKLRSAIDQAEHTSGIDLDLYIARRKVYLSWAFYTGQRQEQLNHLTGDHAGVDVGSYLAFSTKTDGDTLQWEMPEPLILDLRAYLRVTGRDYFEAGEPIGGGEWSACSETITRLFGRAVGPRILRRSYVHRMAELGYSEKEIVDRMGHVDRTMVHEVYHRTLRPPVGTKTRWKALPDHELPGPSGPNVIRFPAR